MNDKRNALKRVKELFSKYMCIELSTYAFTHVLCKENRLTQQLEVVSYLKM